jgi:hypothetical protein
MLLSFPLDCNSFELLACEWAVEKNAVPGCMPVSGFVLRDPPAAWKVRILCLKP